MKEQKEQKPLLFESKPVIATVRIIVIKQNKTNIDILPVTTHFNSWIYALGTIYLPMN